MMKSERTSLFKSMFVKMEEVTKIFVVSSIYEQGENTRVFRRGMNRQQLNRHMLI